MLIAVLTVLFILREHPMKMLIGGVLAVFADIWLTSYIMQFGGYGNWWMFPLFFTSLIVGLCSAVIAITGLAITLNQYFESEDDDD